MVTCVRESIAVLLAGLTVHPEELYMAVLANCAMSWAGANVHAINNRKSNLKLVLCISLFGFNIGVLLGLLFYTDFGISTNPAP